MELQQAKLIIEQVEDQLDDHTFVIAHTFERNNRQIHLAVTENLRKKCKRGKVWKSKPFLTAIKNASYGYDEKHAKSPGGKDGIFLVTREHKPKNQMMIKLFDKFIDKKDSQAKTIAEELKTKLENLIPVRLVSHHLRLLGIIHQTKTTDTLILIDYDTTK